MTLPFYLSSGKKGSSGNTLFSIFRRRCLTTLFLMKHQPTGVRGLVRGLLRLKSGIRS